MAGDTLFDIAKRNGTTVNAIMAQNGLSTTTIYPGQQLVIPASQ
jgi:LysM repeat protein